MKRLLILLSIAGLLITGCGSGEEGHSHGEDADHSHGPSAQQTQQEHSHEHSDKTEQGHSHEQAGGSEHEGEGTHNHEEGDDPNQELRLDETYDEVRKGIRLVLSYDADTDSFTGTMENTTREALSQIRVEVRLSNGTELGPTTPIDLDAGESQPVELDASGETFDGWSAHSEMGSGEHSHGESSEHSHGN